MTVLAQSAAPLPAALTSFLGRDEELAELAEVLDRSRLVTITGPPGIGKTRLARELADGLAEGHPDGVRLVELAAMGNAALVPRAVASALSLQEVPGAGPRGVLIAHLRERRLLLVLDNCEHLLGPCAELVDTLLGSCSKLRVLATSREPLGASGEEIWQVPPLSVPGPTEVAPEGVGDFDAVRLFVERASVAQPGFSLTSYVAPAVAEITRRLDGIPLAIELAAARVETLTPAEIARRLDDPFTFLRKRSGGALARHQTLAAALDWSHDLLSSPERALLRRLSVFVGGFDLTAAEGVCAGEGVEAGEVYGLLTGLVAKSLVVAEVSMSPARYRLLETIRAYGADRLEDAGEAAVRREAHARFYLSLAERAEPELVGPDQQRWLERLEAERENLRFALEWSLGHGQTDWALRLAGALVLYWRVRCHFSEGRDVLHAVISASDAGAPELRAKALWGAGFLSLMAGDPHGAIALLEESLARFRELGDIQGCARALLILANARQSCDDNSALPLLEESAALARQANDRWCLAHALGVAGFERAFLDELPAARGLFEDCLQVARQAADKQSLRMGLLGLGTVTLHQGDLPAAESLLEEAVAVADELREDYTKATALQYLGELAIDRGDYARARELLDECRRLMPEAGPSAALLAPLVLLARVARAQGDRCGAKGLLQEALNLSRAQGGASLHALKDMGELVAQEGNPAMARRLLDEALEVARARGIKAGTAEVLHSLGELDRAEGNARRAATLHMESQQLQAQIGRLSGIASSLEAVAGLGAVAERYEAAARLLGAAQALRDAKGHVRAPWERSPHEGDVALVREALGVDHFDAAFAQGSALSLEDALAESAKLGARRNGAPGGWSSLTETQQRVAALVAEGLTNPEIAERLFISLSTVKAHLAHVFSKLGVARRAELSHEVWRHRGRPPSAPKT